MPGVLFTIIEQSQKPRPHPPALELLGASLSIWAQNEGIKRSSLKCTQMPVPLCTLEQYHEEREAGRICDPGAITDSPFQVSTPFKEVGREELQAAGKAQSH